MPRASGPACEPAEGERRSVQEELRERHAARAAEQLPRRPAEKRRAAPAPINRIGRWRASRSCLATAPSSTSSSRPARTTLHAARLLDQMMGEWPDDGGLSREILKAEQEGDRITHDIIKRLNSTFVTPIDREDIYGLATQMDDIVDLHRGGRRLARPLQDRGADGAGPGADRGPRRRLRAARRGARAPARLQGPRQILDRDPPARERGRPDLPRRRRLALLQRDRPDGRDPLEGHVRGARERDRRDRDRRPDYSRA